MSDLTSARIHIFVDPAWILDILCIHVTAANSGFRQNHEGFVLDDLVISLRNNICKKSERNLQDASQDIRLERLQVY